MRFVRVLVLSLALCLPTIAQPKGGHGGSSHASGSRSAHSHATHTHTASSVPRDSRGHITRDPAARASFQHKNPCPSTGKTSGACPGYVVDHVTPLKRGGTDSPGNMQWQTKQAAKEKDKWE